MALGICPGIWLNNCQMYLQTYWLLLYVIMVEIRNLRNEVQKILFDVNHNNNIFRV